MPMSQRHLPHLYVMGQPLFVTFRLHGSLPPGREFPKGSMSSGKAFVCMDRLLDNHRSSPMYLRTPSLAQRVVDAIQQGGSNSYILHAWVVMPNPVHLLITPRTDVPNLLQKLKGCDCAASQPIAQPNRDVFLAGGKLRSPRAEHSGAWPHRKLHHSEPGASRARPIGGRISVVKRLERRRAEARCRLKPTPQV